MELASSVVPTEDDDQGIASRPSIQLDLKLACWLEPGNGCEVQSRSGIDVRGLVRANESGNPSPDSHSAKEEERDCSRCGEDEEDDGGGRARKKLRLSREQSSYLEESFKECTALTPKQKLAMARSLNLRPRQVEVWFQNRRARTKLKQTEVEYEYLKRCCEHLTKENQRLHAEIQELRSLRSLHQNLDAAAQATVLTLCPSCEQAESTGSVSLKMNPVKRFDTTPKMAC